MFATSMSHGQQQQNGLIPANGQVPDPAAAPPPKPQQHYNIPGIDTLVLNSAFGKVRAGKADTLDQAELVAFQQARSYMAGLKSQQQQQQQQQNHPNPAAPPPSSAPTVTAKVNGVNGHGPSPTPPLASTSAAPYTDLLPRSRWFTKESMSLDDRIGPPLSSLEQRRVKEWIGRDSAFERALGKQKNVDVPRRVGEAVRDEMARPADWLGGWRTREQTQQAKARRAGLSFRMVDQRERDLMRGKRGDRAVGLGLHRLVPSANLVHQHQQQPRHHHQPPQPQKVLIRRRLGKRKMKEVAEEEEMLVPIRLEIEHEHWKLRDTFTWNLRGQPPPIPCAGGRD